MKIALVGSTGYIAGFLKNRLSQEYGLSNIIMIDKAEGVDYYLDLMCPEKFDYSNLKGIEYIVFMAAISGPDKCAKDYDECWNINVTGTNYFIEHAVDNGCKVLFFSSDAVFGRQSKEIFDEESKTKAYTAYGQMKKAVEDKFRDNELFKAIRLSYVMSEKDRFTSYCLDCIRNNKEAEVFHPFYRNVISVTDVEDTVYYFLNNWEEYNYTFYNVAGDELVSRVRIADEINRVFDNRLKYVIASPNEGFFDNRPAITHMKSIYNEKFGIIKSESFTERITHELKGIDL